MFHPSLPRYMNRLPSANLTDAAFLASRVAGFQVHPSGTLMSRRRKRKQVPARFRFRDGGATVTAGAWVVLAPGAPGRG